MFNKVDTTKDVPIVMSRLNQHYEILEIDLTVARTLKGEEIHPYKVEWYNELKVFYAPSDFYIRLNSKDNDAIPIRANSTFTINFYRFNQIYITNEADEGCVLIWLASRLD